MGYLLWTLHPLSLLITKEQEVQVVQVIPTPHLAPATQVQVWPVARYLLCSTPSHSTVPDRELRPGPMLVRVAPWSLTSACLCFTNSCTKYSQCLMMVDLVVFFCTNLTNDHYITIVQKLELIFTGSLVIITSMSVTDIHVLYFRAPGLGIQLLLCRLLIAHFSWFLIILMFQRAENVWIVVPHQLHCGEEMEMVTIFVMLVVFITKWTGPIDH